MAFREIRIWDRWYFHHYKLEHANYIFLILQEYDWYYYPVDVCPKFVIDKKDQCWVLTTNLTSLYKGWSQIAQKVSELAGSIRYHLFISPNQTIVHKSWPIKSQLPNNLHSSTHKAQYWPSWLQHFVSHLIIIIIKRNEQVWFHYW